MREARTLHCGGNAVETISTCNDAMKGVGEGADGGDRKADYRALNQEEENSWPHTHSHTHTETFTLNVIVELRGMQRERDCGSERRCWGCWDQYARSSIRLLRWW